MSFLDDMKNKATDAIKKDPDKIKDGLGKAGDFVDSKTGGKYADKIDQAQRKADDAISKVAGDDGERQPENDRPAGEQRGDHDRPQR